MNQRNQIHTIFSVCLENAYLIRTENFLLKVW